ncbi:ovostatin-like isoform X1 [Dreissena polymorpha]|uniref:ovostatin-like isoform X1 n=1 Tax=Dreissena polymorpha TaxID=45954 RepID=UPI00226534D7|nr:ovostatin-like isoform X1 [Dreissena polymorpha]
MGRRGCMLALLWVSSVISIIQCQPKYVFTMPRAMEAGGQTTFCLQMENMASQASPGIERRVEVDIAFVANSGSMVNHTLTSTLDESNGVLDRLSFCEPIDAPSEAGTYDAIASVTLISECDNVSVIFPLTPTKDAKTTVSVNKIDLITLIQTDKPIYKPGQTVKFRVLTIDYKLKAAVFAFSEITIQTPDNVRVRQWRNITTESGLVSLEMPLSSDPVLGEWTITVEMGLRTETQTFKVDEYVLPKFEVTITPPSYLLPTSQTIAGTVCAKYTYGKPVNGDLKMKLCYKAWGYGWDYGWYSSSHRKARPCATVITKIDGCYDFHVKADEMELGFRQHSSYGTLEIEANVTEDGTGVELSGKKEGPGLSMNPLLLTLEDDSDGYFKPGFPYKGRVIVKNPDGSPAPGEVIEVKMTSNDWKNEYYWGKNFTTDTTGVVHFTITELEDDIGDYYINAEAIVYDNDWRYTDGEIYFRTYTPSSSKSLTRWYSPSNSFIYMPAVKEEGKCGQDLVLDVFYTAQVDSNYIFSARVMAGDNLVHTQEVQITFEGSEASLGLMGVRPEEILDKKKKEKQYFLADELHPPLPPLPVEQIVETVDDIDTDSKEDDEPVEEDKVLAEKYVPIGNGEEIQVSEEAIVPESAQLLESEEHTDSDKTNAVHAIGHFTIKIPVLPVMAPNSQLLLYYMRSDFEVVASTIEFQVKPCFNNTVSMSFDQKEARPGTELNLNVEGAPGSTCFIGMLDKSVTLLGENNQITPEKLMSQVSNAARPWSMHGYWEEDKEYCKKFFNEAEESKDDDMYVVYDVTGKGAVNSFRDAKMWVLTNGVVDSRPCVKNRHRLYFRGPMMMRTADVEDENLEVENDDTASTLTIASSETVPAKAVQIRSFFPETWLWDIVELGKIGQLSMTTTLPDTITEWIGNSLCTHPDSGVGVSELTGITGFQPFFVSLTLPYSAVRGEILPVVATVFNYLQDCISMEVTMKQMEGFALHEGTGAKHEFCLCGGQSETVKFYIVPKVLGEIDLEVIALSTVNTVVCNNFVLTDAYNGVSDGVQRQLLIEPEGQPHVATRSAYMCVKGGESDSETIELALPVDLVPDSERATVSVVGDIMGPTLSNLKNLLHMPYGCGEQNMASWAPNIYVLQYLTSTSQSSPEVEELAKSYMRVGYQRQMKYRHNDKSYSAWGENEYGNATGSLWLTAFCIKTMAHSVKFIDIDKDDLRISGDWILSHQQADGCFPQVGTVFSSYLKGGLEGDNKAGLTAFVLTALIDSGFKDINQTALDAGFSCLDQVMLADVDTYTLSLMAYAYQLYTPDDAQTQVIMEELDVRKKIGSGQVHWERGNAEKVPESDMWWYRAPSAEVEMTAYVMMSMLTSSGGAYETAPIVQWLTRQRNSYGGFSSTQDTVVALQALSMFGARTFSGDSNVHVEVKQDGGGEHMFSVTPDNSLVYQSADLKGSRKVDVSVSGSGCALVQVTMKYSVYKTEDPGPAFGLVVGVFKSKTNRNNCALRTLEVCASYLKDGISNMVISEIKMPTGWVPVKQSLRELASSGDIQKFEVDEDFVELYFDELSKQKKCVTFEVEQVIEMNPKAARVQVYDYYETSYSVTVSYEIKTTCGTKEEIPVDNAGMDCSMVQCRENSVDYEESVKMSCPSCPDRDISIAEMTELVCERNISSVLKAVVGREGIYPIKIMADLRPKQKMILDSFVKYQLGSDCSCPILQMKESKALIFREKGDNKEDIDFSAQDTVLPFSEKLEKSVRTLVSKESLCAKLDRFRRSKSPESDRMMKQLLRKVGILP